MNSAQSYFRKLNVAQRRVLIEHVATDDPIPYIAGKGSCTRALLSMGLLKAATLTVTVRATKLTTIGREVVCMVLAEYAEALIMAGAGTSPLERVLANKSPLERLIELRKITNVASRQAAGLLQVAETVENMPKQSNPDL